MVLKAIRRDHISRRVQRGTSIANEDIAVVKRVDGECEREAALHHIANLQCDSLVSEAQIDFDRKQIETRWKPGSDLANR